MLSTLLYFFLMILIVVSFHEWGHYLAARLFKVRILRFSVGIGKVLLKRKDRRGTEWCISLLPLGGYVQLDGESSHGASTQPQSTSASSESALPEKPAWQRFIIFFAGPFFSLLLGVIVFTGLNLRSYEAPLPELGKPATHTPAAMAGVKPGDLVLRVNEKAILSWNDLYEDISGPLFLGGNVELEVLSPEGQKKNLLLHLPGLGKQDPNQVDLLAQSGITLNAPEIYLEQVLPDTPAQQAGLRSGDVIEGWKEGDTLIKRDERSPQTLIHWLKSGVGTPHWLRVKTPGASPRWVSLIPDTTTHQIGVILGLRYHSIRVNDGFLKAVEKGILQTGRIVSLSYQSLRQIVVRQMSVKSLSGPISIAKMAGETGRQGWVSFLGFIGFFSVALGFFNLIPIPVLDGGQMLLAVVEMIIGKPLSTGVANGIMYIGFFVMAAIMLFVIWLDIMRFF